MQRKFGFLWVRPFHPYHKASDLLWTTRLVSIFSTLYRFERLNKGFRAPHCNWIRRYVFMSRQCGIKVILTKAEYSLWVIFAMRRDRIGHDPRPAVSRRSCAVCGEYCATKPRTASCPPPAVRRVSQNIFTGRQFHTSQFCNWGLTVWMVLQKINIGVAFNSIVALVHLKVGELLTVAHYMEPSLIFRKDYKVYIHAITI